MIADPPYGSTSLAWDKWPKDWPFELAEHVPENAALWLFGTMRMYFDHLGEFADWKFSQHVVWEKHNGSGFAADRFRPVHENAIEWYRGPREKVFVAPQFTNDATARQVRRKGRPPHTGSIGVSTYESEDGGPRLMRSVIRVPSVHGDADVANETQKPIGIIEPLVRYSLAPGKVLLEPFMGAGTALVVAKQLGALGVGCDTRENQCEAAAKRLVQTMVLG